MNKHLYFVLLAGAALTLGSCSFPMRNYLEKPPAKPPKVDTVRKVDTVSTGGVNIDTFSHRGTREASGAK